MATGEPIELALLGLTLVVLAGLNPPLTLLALGFASGHLPVGIRSELLWLIEPPMWWIWSGFLVLQFLADLYFIPASISDRPYLHSARVVNSYLNARLQSFVRPLVAALVLAALPLPLPAQSAAVVGFIAGTAIYWSTAWVREQVAMSRGSVILLLVEMAKNLSALVVVVLVNWSPPLALGALGVFLTAMTWWATRLRRELSLYSSYGGRVAPEDS